MLPSSSIEPWVVFAVGVPQKVVKNRSAIPAFDGDAAVLGEPLQHLVCDRVEDRFRHLRVDMGTDARVYSCVRGHVRGHICRRAQAHAQTGVTKQPSLTPMSSSWGR